VGIFDSVENDEKIGVLRNLSVTRCRSECDYSLMRLLTACGPIEGGTLLEAHVDARGAAEVHNLLDTWSSGAFSDEYTVEGAACFQGLAHRVDTNEETHGLMLQEVIQNRLHLRII
jgi:hypothetical protein